MRTHARCNARLTIGKLFQLLRHRSVTSLQRAEDINGIPVLLWRDERHACPLIARTTRAASTVNVVFHVVRCVVVDNEFELLDIKTTGGDRGGDDNGDDTRLEIRDSRVTVDLVLAAMERHAQVTLAHEFAKEVVGGLLPVDEDERTTLRIFVIRLSEDLEETVELRLLFADLDDLLNLRGHN